MGAYVIVDIEVHNREKYPEYLAQITPTVYACGGRYWVRGAQAEVVSGQWQPKRLVVMEFPSVEVARHWATCAEYAPIHALRNAYASANMIIVEGSVDFSG
ncbi:DUF1330 domain-containing protein [Cellvibrio japonicus]|uniref:DUF1330 domain-containing protein n=1 Tax=Cellvibrio japonicus (strain Ueda107) TaxID=498211 RepID=B3PJ42_CELJU|nr:DUF1330 domain-containing protein [Cellvibrio japonicus]ACE83666.1 conserved hypothetical protein [Cellvibrio japonicus Ueda107]QEI11242.1 DUF1330 domain-containing protein [Cellvibrio japonicus]QEI14816.1 DUF1330 domain-containing protein [Cellvibrio japonicus]QEI18396.1 DUF1330 domain-containing protein [Cellvibrio japonicus]